VSSSSPPPAEGVRVDWNDLPGVVRRAIEDRVGGRVVEAVTQRNGFSPGLAARIRTSDGRRCFVKAVSENANPDTPGIHRREAEVVAALPAGAPVPRLLWTYDDGGWVALGFTDIEGHTPRLPWREDELAMVVAGLERLHQALTPPPMESTTAAQAFMSTIRGWDEIRSAGATGLDPWSARHLDRLVDLEAAAPGMLSGQTLLNFDVRADNIIITNRQAYFVDWPWARIGPPFVEWVGLAPSVFMQGGPPPADLLRRAAMEGVSDEAIDAVLASLTGYFLGHARRPPPPGIPTVRAFQAAQGEVALAWLRQRLGWA
jgi:phosphotransferase family enzyme